MTGIHCRVSHDPMTDTTLSLTATSVPIIVHPDIDKYIHSFLPKLVECRHCVGSQMLRKVNSWAVPKEYMDSVPKHVYYLKHTLKPCSYCKEEFLCSFHFKDAVHNSKRYMNTVSPDIAMCHGCSWGHV